MNIQKILLPLWTRIQMMFTKATVETVSDEKEIQLLKISALDGETQDGVERIQNYGLSSNPPKDGEVLVASMNGNKDHPVAIVVDCGQYRKKNLASGEVVLYHKDGSYILLGQDKSINFESGKDFIVTQAGLIKLGNSSLLPLAGVVTGECLDPITGVPFPDKSSKVFALKA